MKKLITWEITEEQVEQIVRVLDVATKATGIEGAQATVPIMNSLMQAVEKSKETINQIG